MNNTTTCAEGALIHALRGLDELRTDLIASEEAHRAATQRGDALDEELRDALVDAKELQNQVAETTAQIIELHDERERVFAERERAITERDLARDERELAITELQEARRTFALQERAFVDGLDAKDTSWEQTMEDLKSRHADQVQKLAEAAAQTVDAAKKEFESRLAEATKKHVAYQKHSDPVLERARAHATTTAFDYVNSLVHPWMTGPSHDRDAAVNAMKQYLDLQLK